MTGIVRTDLSLADTAHKHQVDVYVVFRDIQTDRGLWRKWLKSGYQHVEIWQYVPPGAWLRFDVSVELIVTEVFSRPPWEMIPSEWRPTCIRARRSITHGKIREPFFIGPVTCVELAKAFLGVSSFFVRTPYQLYKFLKRERQ